jgi:glucose-1-phosphate thymidylyltransferase
VSEECAADIDVTYVAHDGRRDLRSTLAAVEPFVGEEPCVVSAADGVGQPLPSVTEVLADGSPDVALFLHRGAGGQRLGAAAEQLLGIADSSRSGLGLAGVCFLGPGALRRACSSASPNSPADLIAIAATVAGGGGRLHVRQLQPWRRYTGDPADLLEMNRIVLDQLPEGAWAEEWEGSRIEGRALIDPSAEVSSSVIVGPAVIGAGSRISNAYIGPYTSVGRGVTIEGAELERSIVGDGAQIMHVSDRIVASTLGRGCRIFRDFGLPRGMRLHAGDGVTLALS